MNEKQKILCFNVSSFLKWVIFSITSGLCIGFIGSIFYLAINYVTKTRLQHPNIIFLLPLGGVAIVFLYKIAKNEKDRGTNLVLSALHSGEEIPLKMAPLIFMATLITHFFGGSAGREGAALQLGGSLGNGLGKLFKMESKDTSIMIMCGMSAAFSALFGTPMAAAIFSLEVVTIGVINYSALLPCVISSFTAHFVAVALGVAPEVFHIQSIPDFTVTTSLIIIFVACLCAVISILFCFTLHQAEHVYKKFFKNPYIRIIVGGCLVIAMTLLVGNQRYNGAGLNIMEECMEHPVGWEVFILKLVFTALTLGCGFKGGEIVPSFFVGGTFGCFLGSVLGFSPSLCAAVGMVAVFCGVTNSPITAILIAFELFGFEAMPYFVIACAFTFVLSGYTGLYSSQKILYKKYSSGMLEEK